MILINISIRTSQQVYDEDMFREEIELEDLQVVNIDRVANVSVVASILSKKTEKDKASKSSNGSLDTKKKSHSLTVTVNE
jgi:hypothetical protein